MQYKVIRELQYVDLDRELTDDELLHFKYIDKKRLPNGKWRYIYAQTANDLKRAKENFDWGYEIGTHKDPNTGRALNSKNVNPDVYKRLADGYADLSEKSAPDPFYEGEKKEKFIKDTHDYANKKLGEELENYVRAKSFMGKIGQITGRTITNSKYRINRGKSWLTDKFGIH